MTGDILFDERERDTRLVMERSGTRDERVVSTAAGFSSLGHVKSDGMLNEADYQEALRTG